MKKLKHLLLVTVAMVSASGCVDDGTPRDPDSPNSGDDPDSPNPDSPNSGDPIVGAWRAPFSDGTADRLDISKSLVGTAQLYWYDYSWADWDVSVAVNGGVHVVTLRCSSDPDCAGAEPIVMSCEPLSTRMSCVASSGGYDNNYAGVTFDWTK